MEFQEAIRKADQILEEERVSPTARYKYRDEGEPSLGRIISTLGRPSALQTLRSQRPRQVQEDPRIWRFESTNYNLLCALLSQLQEKDKNHFLTSVLLRLSDSPGCIRMKSNVQPSWNGLSSELPLIAEFCTRNGPKQNFFGVLREATPLPGHVLLLGQLEDMIALNFTLFSDSEYEQAAFSVSILKMRSQQQLDDFRAKQGRGEIVWPQIGDVGVQTVFAEIMARATGIEEQCRKARFLYLKASLLEGLNLEVNQDREAVQSYLQTLGFSNALAESLNEVDRLYFGTSTAFDLKSCMGLLRSVLETLHGEALPAFQAKPGNPLPERWGERLTYLRENGILSKAEEKFVSALFGLISDEAVHPIIAEREYARLARNMVIEYALLFLRKLDKLKLKPARRT